MNIVEVQNDEQSKDIINNNEYVIVKFGADWCGPCKTLDPIFNNLSENSEISSKVKFARINIDEITELAAEAEITSIPMLIIYKNGTKTAQKAGVKQEKELLEWIKEVINQ